MSVVGSGFMVTSMRLTALTVPYPYPLGNVAAFCNGKEQFVKVGVHVAK